MTAERCQMIEAKLNATFQPQELLVKGPVQAA